MSRSTACALLAVGGMLALTGCNGGKGSQTAQSLQSPAAGASAGSSASSSSSASPGVVATNTSQVAPAASNALPGHASQVIRQQWERFFDGMTPYADRVRLLQHGNQFQSYFAQHRSDRDVVHLGSRVTGVQLVNAGLAHVRFTLYEGNRPIAQNLAGTAILNQATWRVSAATFCSVVTKYGQPKPSVCP